MFESKEYHYGLPSGWHANKFVRLGDALRTIYDVQRIAEWLLPYVSKHTIVVGDTGSILPLLMALRELAKSHLGWDVAISTLDEYPRDKLAIMDAVQAANKRPAVVTAQYLEAELSWLFVISVNSSGRLCSWLSQHMPVGSKIVVVCQTSSRVLKKLVIRSFSLSSGASVRSLVVTWDFLRIQPLPPALNRPWEPTAAASPG